MRDYEFLKAVVDSWVEQLDRLVVKEDGTVGEADPPMFEVGPHSL